MFRVGFARLLFTLVALPVLCEASVDRNRTEKSIGTAEDADGNLYYVEDSTAYFKDDKLTKIETRYFDATGKLHSTIDFDFKKSLYIPDSTYKDLPRKLEDHLFLHPDTARIEMYRVQNGVEIERKQVPTSEHFTSGAGMVFFVRDKLPELIQDHRFHFRILVPAKFKDYGFRVYRNENSTRANAKNTLNIRVDIDFWLFRLFAPDIDFVYDIEKKRPLVYEGPAAIADLKGHRPTVRVKFDYPRVNTQTGESG